jgi:hypothetical protein
MRNIEIAESFARAARQAGERGEHRKAARLFAQAVKALKTGGPSNVLSHFAEGTRWTAGLDGGGLSEADLSPPPSTIRR